MKIMRKPIVCYCGTLTERKIITKKVPIGLQDILLENIPAEVCPGCGEIYFDGKMLLDFEKAVMKKSVQKTYR